MKFAALRSLGLKTDIEIARFENKLTERENYLVIETPGNPDFYWGNFLVFPHAPKAGDQEKWPEIFRKEFHNPLIQHMAFTWDSPEGEKGVDFPGFILEVSPIYSLNKTKKPARMNEEVSVRPLVSDEDWEATIHNQVRCRGEGFEETGYYQFKRPQMARYRRLSEAGHGNWFGAFLDGKLVADAGLFHFASPGGKPSAPPMNGPDSSYGLGRPSRAEPTKELGDSIGRFQSVATHPDFRRRGIGSALVYHMAEAGLKRSATLVIVADPTMGADRIYRSVGFAGEEISVQLTRRSPRDQI